jgi:hypothetical protein
MVGGVHNALAGVSGCVEACSIRLVVGTRVVGVVRRRRVRACDGTLRIAVASSANCFAA